VVLHNLLHSQGDKIRNVLSGIYGTFCGPIAIPRGARGESLL